ncbi:hypothetical protein EI94DRAFT_1800018 [Lactarius quietus]|nr:hypothetical protein EI94DRAFT_1800018 [Lactarius quietus]
MLDNPEVFGTMGWYAPIYWGDIHAKPCWDMGPAAEYTCEELQYLRADFRGQRQVDEALARLGDISLAAEVRRYCTSQEVIKELEEAIKKLKDNIFVHVDRSRHSVAWLGLPFTKVITALTYIKGPFVDDWVNMLMKDLVKVTTTGATGYKDKSDASLWTNFENGFKNAWGDTAKKQMAMDQLFNLKMEGTDIDTYNTTVTCEQHNCPKNTNNPHVRATDTPVPTNASTPTTPSPTTTPTLNPSITTMPTLTKIQQIQALIGSMTEEEHGKYLDAQDMGEDF